MFVAGWNLTEIPEHSTFSCCGTGGCSGNCLSFIGLWQECLAVIGCRCSGCLMIGQLKCNAKDMPLWICLVCEGKWISSMQILEWGLNDKKGRWFETQLFENEMGL